jgi:hypothetical protein
MLRMYRDVMKNATRAAPFEAHSIELIELILSERIELIELILSERPAERPKRKGS